MNFVKNVVLFGLLNPCTFSLLSAQSPLFIPPALQGKTFNLNVQSGKQTFYNGVQTPTFGINGIWMAPTLFVNKGDSVTLNVSNKLIEPTTMHWHGLHVAAKYDGGPHQQIKPGSTWSPSFKIRNNAGTFWYHPHGINQTEKQIGKGLAGLLIVKDSIESKLSLPRTYGVDDFPIILQSKAFDELTQIAIASEMDTAMFVNGTLNPFLKTPAQVIRLRVLNASNLRSYNLGFSNNQNFYIIGTDGGLIDTPVLFKRLILSPGERIEILVNLSGMEGKTVNLKSFASELPKGIYGASSIGSGIDTIPVYKSNRLNGNDYDLLQLIVDSATKSAIYSIPNSLVPYTPFNFTDATNTRNITIDTIRLLKFERPNRALGPFGMNEQSFNIDSINQIIKLNSTEIWSIKNHSLVAHTFHIHDVQFNILESGGVPPKPSERGWKDVVLIKPEDSVKFITKFSDFYDNEVPYMYHCHLLHHEDDGMMGSFLVIDTSRTGISKTTQSSLQFSVTPNPFTSTFQINSVQPITSVKILNLDGVEIFKIKSESITSINLESLSSGMYIIQSQSDCNFGHKILIKQ